MRGFIYFFKLWTNTILLYLWSVGFLPHLFLVIIFSFLFFIFSLDDSLPGILFPLIGAIGVYLGITKMFQMCPVDLHTLTTSMVDPLEKMDMTSWVIWPHLIQILVEEIAKRILTRNMTAKWKYLKDCYMEDEIYYHFILYGNSRVSYKEKMY